MLRRSLLLIIAAAASAVSSFAQTSWPSKPVKIVVPAPAGSSLDLIVRAMSDKLGARWGQGVVVENKPGAGGMLGMDVVAKAGDGGHTLGIGFNGPIAFAPFLYRKMPYDPAKDLVAVVMTTSQPNVLAVGAGVVHHLHFLGVEPGVVHELQAGEQAGIVEGVVVKRQVFGEPPVEVRAVARLA